MDITNTLKGVVILDLEGQRTLAKSFDKRTSSRQFEKKLFARTKSNKTQNEVFVLDDMLVLHRFMTGLHIYVVGNKIENPLILDSFLNCLVEVITSLLNKNVERQSIMDHLAPVILALDEMCDNGMILETDYELVLQRVSLKDDAMEQSMAQRLQSATENIRFSWLKY